MTPTNPDQLEEMLKDADENGANFISPINWRRLGPKFVTLWRVAERMKAENATLHSNVDFTFLFADLEMALKKLEET